eukprot:TRINITY_DN286_c0_g1_i1.p1 TRINITY_DN286_c0_g1~~TRINITY_DN286_c0_g1_i1.p1  ORF type:complete len:135 (-),score=15.75 TRINITY_DN286_c0_g1_i1:105-509(-)
MTKRAYSLFFLLCLIGLELVIGASWNPKSLEMMKRSNVKRDITCSVTSRCGYGVKQLDHILIHYELDNLLIGLQTLDENLYKLEAATFLSSPLFTDPANYDLRGDGMNALALFNYVLQANEDDAAQGVALPIWS